MTSDKIVRQRFTRPGQDSKPTPLYWWSGGDIDISRLQAQLVKLKERGIGGTIVGYSHLPNGDLDHGNPKPLSPNWWATFKSFVELNAQLGMSVGIQDYGIIGSILLAAGAQTKGLNAGSLSNISELISGPTIFREPNLKNVLSRRAISLDGELQLDIASVNGDTVVWNVPPGQWVLSTVTINPGKISLYESTFDPMHPNSGAEVIKLFYSKFEQELGEYLGTTFTTFFQDELDLGLTTPMWNDLVSERLEQRGYRPLDSIHLLWHGNEKNSYGLRATHRDAVVDLLQKNFFKPIFEWHERHSTILVMDQLSRGDLELGYKHYGDFLETMSWFHGPGNDDPDLTQPRNISAFRISSSIAHLNNRTLVANEAFHSSGWGVTPKMILSGLNIDFAAGANQVILHGLNYTTDAGWWEWASPDFHFRQPWWEHSEPVWTYITRISEMLRLGKPVVDVAILDPTQDLVFESNSSAPKTTASLLEFLTLNALNADLVPQSYLGKTFASSTHGRAAIEAREAQYSVVVVPDIATIRKDALTSLQSFVAQGGLVIALDKFPEWTEEGRIQSSDLVDWLLVKNEASVLQTIIELFEVDLKIASPAEKIIYSHRKIGEVDIYFIVNSGTQASEFEIELRRLQAIEFWDPWSGLNHLYPSREVADSKGLIRQRATINLQPGESVLLVQPEIAIENSDQKNLRNLIELDFSSDWTLEVENNLDNSFGDFVLPAQSLPVASYNIEISENPNGPWSSGLINHGSRFLVAGPLDETAARQTEIDIINGSAFSKDALGNGWRQYVLSLQTGIPKDPYLLDRNTGPHGLKGVQEEFLDPLAVDEQPVPGSFYYFCSYVDSLGGPEVIRSQGRAAYKIWLNSEVILETREDQAEFFPPWGLRDMSSEETSTKVNLERGSNLIVVRVEVSGEQPSRVAVVVGGKNPDKIEKSLCRWWAGDQPALKYHVPNTVKTKWFRVDVPVGAKEATIYTSADLDPSSVSKFKQIEGGFKLEVIEGERLLTFALNENPSSLDPLDAGALTAAITWDCTPARSALASWSELGLRDFSGLVRYKKNLEIKDELPEHLYIRIENLEGSAVVKVNSFVAGTIVLGSELIRIDEFLVRGTNVIEIDAANTLVNFFSRLPSPFSVMQQPGGGFTGAYLMKRNS